MVLSKFIIVKKFKNSFAMNDKVYFVKKIGPAVILKLVDLRKKIIKK